MDQLPGRFVHQHHRSNLPVLKDGREAFHHPVLIVGGGPVGLAVALGLARRGIRSVVVEADDTVCIGSRAICLSRRTLEILDRLGVLEPFQTKGLPWTGGRSYFRDREVLSFLMPNDNDQRLAPMTNLQQYYIEQFLLEAVLRESDLIELRWSTRIESVTPGEASVAVSLSAGGTTYETSADYLIACDGARSAVRQGLGLRMTGSAYDSRYIIADIEIALDLPTERLVWFDPPSAPGRTMIMHKQPDDLWRFDYQIDADEDAEKMVRPERVALVIEAHLAMLGITEPWRMVWTSVYRATAVSLERYRQGRVMFAGDAAHLVPIFGVRGLNGGFDDAFNLVWKLDYVLNGKAGEALLDSYSAERHFAWEVNVANAMRSTEFMAPPSRGFELMRNAVLSLADRYPALKTLVNPRQSSAITYAQSPLNDPDSEEDDFASGPVPGQTIPEAPLIDSESCPIFLTQQLSADFTVLGFDGAEPLAAWDNLADLTEASGVPVKLIRIRPTSAAPRRRSELVDETARAAKLFDARPGTTYLIRPDGHVCGRWRHPSPQVLARAIRQALAQE